MAKKAADEHMALCFSVLLICLWSVLPNDAASLCYIFTVGKSGSGPWRHKVQGQLNKETFLSYISIDNCHVFGVLGSRLNATKICEKQNDILNDGVNLIKQQASHINNIIREALTVQAEMCCWNEEDGHLNASWDIDLNGHKILHFDSSTGKLTEEIMLHLGKKLQPTESLLLFISPDPPSLTPSSQDIHPHDSSPAASPTATPHVDQQPSSLAIKPNISVLLIILPYTLLCFPRGTLDNDRLMGTEEILTRVSDNTSHCSLTSPSPQLLQGTPDRGQDDSGIDFARVAWANDNHNLQGTMISQYKPGQLIDASWKFTIDGQYAFCLNRYNQKNKKWEVITYNATGILEQWENNAELAQDLATLSMGDSDLCLKEIFKHQKEMPNDQRLGPSGYNVDIPVGSTIIANIPRLYRHGHRLTVFSALEERDELQHRIPAANSKQGLQRCLGAAGDDAGHRNTGGSRGGTKAEGKGGSGGGSKLGRWKTVGAAQGGRARSLPAPGPRAPVVTHMQEVNWISLRYKGRSFHVLLLHHFTVLYSGEDSALGGVVRGGGVAGEHPQLQGEERPPEALLYLCLKELSMEPHPPATPIAEREKHKLHLYRLVEQMNRRAPVTKPVAQGMAKKAATEHMALCFSVLLICLWSMLPLDAASLCYIFTVGKSGSGPWQHKVQGQLNEETFLSYNSINNCHVFGVLGIRLNATKICDKQVDTLKDGADLIKQQVIRMNNIIRASPTATPHVDQPPSSLAIKPNISVLLIILPYTLLCFPRGTLDNDRPQGFTQCTYTMQAHIYTHEIQINQASAASTTPGAVSPLKAGVTELLLESKAPILAGQMDNVGQGQTHKCDAAVRF
ncbi:hypothetical protein NN561_006278 [Cricetulus griseus]